VYCAAQLIIWRIEGKPDGIERRVLQLLGK
jgi:hypothetical protein